MALDSSAIDKGTFRGTARPTSPLLDDEDGGGRSFSPEDLILAQTVVEGLPPMWDEFSVLNALGRCGVFLADGRATLMQLLKRDDIRWDVPFSKSSFYRLLLGIRVCNQSFSPEEAERERRKCHVTLPSADQAEGLLLAAPFVGDSESDGGGDDTTAFRTPARRVLSRHVSSGASPESRMHRGGGGSKSASGGGGLLEASASAAFSPSKMNSAAQQRTSTAPTADVRAAAAHSPLHTSTQPKTQPRDEPASANGAAAALADHLRKAPPRRRQKPSSDEEANGGSPSGAMEHHHAAAPRPALDHVHVGRIRAARGVPHGGHRLAEQPLGGGGKPSRLMQLLATAYYAMRDGPSSSSAGQNRGRRSDEHVNSSLVTSATEGASSPMAGGVVGSSSSIRRTSNASSSPSARGGRGVRGSSTASGVFSVSRHSSQTGSSGGLMGAKSRSGAMTTFTAAAQATKMHRRKAQQADAESEIEGCIKACIEQMFLRSRVVGAEVADVADGGGGVLGKGWPPPPHSTTTQRSQLHGAGDAASSPAAGSAANRSSKPPLLSSSSSSVAMGGSSARRDSLAAASGMGRRRSLVRSSPSPLTPRSLGTPSSSAAPGPADTTALAAARSTTPAAVYDGGVPELITIGDLTRMLQDFPIDPTVFNALGLHKIKLRNLLSFNRRNPPPLPPPPSSVDRDDSVGQSPSEEGLQCGGGDDEVGADDDAVRRAGANGKGRVFLEAGGGEGHSISERPLQPILSAGSSPPRSILVQPLSVSGVAIQDVASVTFNDSVKLLGNGEGSSGPSPRIRRARGGGVAARRQQAEILSVNVGLHEVATYLTQTERNSPRTSERARRRWRECVDKVCAVHCQSSRKWSNLARSLALLIRARRAAAEAANAAAAAAAAGGLQGEEAAMAASQALAASGIAAASTVVFDIGLESDVLLNSLSTSNKRFQDQVVSRRVPLRLEPQTERSDAFIDSMMSHTGGHRSQEMLISQMCQSCIGQSAACEMARKLRALRECHRLVRHGVAPSDELSALASGRDLASLKKKKNSKRRGRGGAEEEEEHHLALHPPPPPSESPRQRDGHGDDDVRPPRRKQTLAPPPSSSLAESQPPSRSHSCAPPPPPRGHGGGEEEGRADEAVAGKIENEKEGPPHREVSVGPTTSSASPVPSCPPPIPAEVTTNATPFRAASELRPLEPVPCTAEQDHALLSRWLTSEVTRKDSVPATRATGGRKGDAAATATRPSHVENPPTGAAVTTATANHRHQPTSRPSSALSQRAHSRPQSANSARSGGGTEPTKSATQGRFFWRTNARMNEAARQDFEHRAQSAVPHGGGDIRTGQRLSTGGDGGGRDEDDCPRDGGHPSVVVRPWSAVADMYDAPLPQRRVVHVR